MKNSLLRVRDLDRTSKIKISRRRLTENVKNFHHKACRTSNTMTFARSTNQRLDLWRCRCRRHFFNSLTKHTRKKQKSQNSYHFPNVYFQLMFPLPLYRRCCLNSPILIKNSYKQSVHTLPQPHDEDITIRMHTTISSVQRGSSHVLMTAVPSSTMFTTFVA